MLLSAISDLPPGYWVDPVTGAWCTLPWPADPDEREDLASSSLGPALIDWSEGRTDEPGLTDYQTGLPWRWTPGQKRFLCLWYAVSPWGRWRFRSGVKRGAKGTGKDPFAAGWSLLELLGPSRIDPEMSRDGRGRLVGRRHSLPLVQIASNSEAQSKDVLRIANAMLNGEARAFYGVDPGETRTILKDSGARLELLTASERSSEGDPATAIVLNESHHMIRSSGGHKIAEVARRNVGKSPAALQARVLECTNAHLTGTDSVAERSYEAWQLQVSGRTVSRVVDILYDSIEAPPTVKLHDLESRAMGLRAAYMDAPWADLERLADEVMDPRTAPGDSIRYYLNGLAAAEDAWVDPRRFDALADGGIGFVDGDQVAMFLDCSKSQDATGLVACRIADGHVMTVRMWQRPHGDRGQGWLAPRHEVDAEVRAMFDRYRVSWFGVDPSPARDDDDEALYWGELIDSWHRDLRNKVAIWATPGAGGNSVKFDMRLSQPGGVKRNQAFTEEAMATAHAIDNEDRPFTHDGHAALRMHVHNARRRPNQWGYSLGKTSRDSSDLIDLAVCMVGARLGRRLVLNTGKARKTGRERRAIVL